MVQVQESARAPQAVRGRAHPKGRQVDPAALDEVREVLAGRSRQRDLLIEYLHLVQERFGHLQARHLAALAEELRLPQAAVYEVATFYAHFDVVKEDETPPPPLTIRVCTSLTCAMAGAERLIAECAPQVDGTAVRIVPAPCVGRCAHAPVAEVGHRYLDNVSTEALLAALRRPHTEPDLPDYVDFDTYVRDGGYRVLERYRDLGGAGDAAEDAALELIAALNDAGLRGLGGAGFPTGRKFEFVRKEPKPRYLAVNADEGEPGTFKDRYYLERDPHRFMEGVLIAAWAIEAATVYIYLRDEYPAVRLILQRELDRLEREGIVKPETVLLRRGAGAYICGEESAMLESIEGKRGLPRHRPPYAAQVGLFGRPTLINNVETLYWIRDIVERGVDWFASQGRHGSKGLRSYSVSGRVREPGVKRAPAGITAQELIDEFCGGMADGHVFKAYLPGGASGGILPASMADIPLDFGKLEEHGCFIGSHAVIVLSDQDDMKAVALNLLRFFGDESCGQCTPCRVGCEKAVKLMDRKAWDEVLLEELCRAMTDASICGLGQAAPNPIRSVLKHFPDEVGIARGGKPIRQEPPKQW